MNLITNQLSKTSVKDLFWTSVDWNRGSTSFNVRLPTESPTSQEHHTVALFFTDSTDGQSNACYTPYAPNISQFCSFLLGHVVPQSPSESIADLAETLLAMRRNAAQRHPFE